MAKENIQSRKALMSRILTAPVTMEQLKKRLRISFSLAFFFFVGLFLATSWMFASFMRAEDRWTHYSEEKLLLVRLVSDLKDAETGQRGYLITGNEEYLSPYRKARSRIQEDMRSVSGIEKLDVRLNGLRKVLLRLVHQKMGELEETIRLRHVAGFRAARDMVMSDYGKQVMDQVRAISLQMGTLLSRKRDFERQLLLARERRVFAAGSVLAVSIVFFWVLLYRIIGKEIETRESLLLRLKEESTHDALTGLFNRPAAMDILQHSIANAERRKWKIGVLMIDLDGFKGVNDQWGHLAGDQALVEVARRFRQVVREGDILARLGGDEFLCLMPVLEGLEGALNLGNRLLGVFRDPIQEAAFTSRLGCSIGVAVYPEDGEDPKSLLAAADRRLYAAKDKGGHCLCFKDECPDSDIEV